MSSSSFIVFIKLIGNLGSAILPQFLTVWGEDLQDLPSFCLGSLQQSEFKEVKN